MDSESDTDPGESVSDTEGDGKALSATKEETGTKIPSRKKLLKKKPTKKKVIKKLEGKTPQSPEEDVVKNKRTKKSVVKHNEVDNKKNLDGENIENGRNLDEPKGRDFDLNEIRSELKGIDKAVKTNTELAIANTVEGIKEVTSEEKVFADDTKVAETSVSSITQSIKESEIDLGAKTEEKGSGKPNVKEDIYEFKEPEPFEYQEVLRPINRVYEEGDRSPDKSNKKPIMLPEKKEMSKFEVDVKSRFRKTIGKKMKEVTSADLKKDLNVKSDKIENFSKIENFVSMSYQVHGSEKEISPIKVESAEILKAISPEPVHLCPPNQDEVNKIFMIKFGLTITETNLIF